MAPRASRGGGANGRGGEGVPVRRSDEKAKEREARLAGVFVVLMRARERGPGLCSELATATARWRPRSSARMVWRGEGAPSRGVEERRKLWRDAWEGHVKLEVAGWPRAAVAVPLRRRSERKQEGRLEVEGSGLVYNFRNSRDLTVNQQ